MGLIRVVLCSLLLHYIPQCLHWEGGEALVCSLPDEKGSSTHIMMEAEPLLMARCKGSRLHVVVQLGVEGQYPLALKLRLPVCPQSMRSGDCK